MTEEQRVGLLSSLKDLLKNGPKNKHYGICHNTWIPLLANPLFHETPTVYDFINELALGWPMHSGEEHYPIPSTDKKLKTACDYYAKREGKHIWKYSQGRLRRDLIRYMIKKLERNQQG